MLKAVSTESEAAHRESRQPRLAAARAGTVPAPQHSQRAAGSSLTPSGAAALMENRRALGAEAQARRVPPARPSASQLPQGSTRERKAVPRTRVPVAQRSAGGAAGCFSCAEVTEASADPGH